MKILMITPYVTINSRPEFCRNKTGFGYMVYDIAKAVAKTEYVDVLCTDSRGEGFEQDKIHFLPRHLYNLKPSLRFFPIYKSIINQYHPSKGATIRLLYYTLMANYVEKIIRKGNYDVIHVHGCSFADELWDTIAKRCNTKIVYTLHGLNSFSDTVKLEPAGKQYERDFLKKVVNGERRISVISSGMKKTILSCFNVKDCDNIVLINNSFSFANLDSTKDYNIRKKYNIPNDDKIFLYVGNISENKNQTQMVRAFNLLSDELQSKTYILFIGGNSGYEALTNAINDSLYENHLILCSSIDKEYMPEIYRQADAVALLSIAEGFGLSLIEGMHFGLPCMTFTDLDAYDDIYNPDAVIGIPTRNDQTVADSIKQLLTNNWNREAIKSYSKKFESDEMARRYIKFFEV